MFEEDERDDNLKIYYKWNGDSHEINAISNWIR
jgi:hypothetical protein